MKQLNYSIVAAGAVMVLATFLPFDFSGSMWHPGTLASPFNALAFLVGALAVLQLAGAATRHPELALDSLFRDGAIGAQALWLASLVAGAGGVVLAVRPQRIAAHHIGVP